MKIRRQRDTFDHGYLRVFILVICRFTSLSEIYRKTMVSIEYYTTTYKFKIDE